MDILSKFQKIVGHQVWGLGLLGSTTDHASCVVCFQLRIVWHEGPWGPMAFTHESSWYSKLLLLQWCRRMGPRRCEQHKLAAFRFGSGLPTHLHPHASERERKRSEDNWTNSLTMAICWPHYWLFPQQKLLPFACKNTLWTTWFNITLALDR